MLRVLRYLILPFLVLLVLLVNPPVPADAATVRIIGLSKAGDGKETQQRIVGLAMKTQPGDELQVFDARDRKRIAVVSIPDDPKFKKVERRLPLLVQPMRELKAFTDAMSAKKPHEPDLIHGVGFLDEVGTLVAKYPNQDVRVLLLGSAWFSAPGATERTEYRGVYPSDGLIMDDRSASPFGTSGLRDLNGVAVTYCFTEAASDFLNLTHRDRIERAWSLEITQRGGSLVAFTGDQKSCWDSFAGDAAPEPRKFTIDPEDARMRYMYKPEDAAPRIKNAPTIKTVRSDQHAPEASRRREAARFRQRVSTTPPTRRDGPAWLGVKWDDPVDLDLYARCSPGMPLLFFGNTRSAEGRHNFDYRSATGEAFETIDLLESCPDITRAQVFINFYDGSLRHSPKGVFAIEFAGKFFKADFTIPAQTGNKAAGLKSGMLNPPNWVRIDLASVLRLKPTAEGRSIGTGAGLLK